MKLHKHGVMLALYQDFPSLDQQKIRQVVRVLALEFITTVVEYLPYVHNSQEPWPATRLSCRCPIKLCHNYVIYLNIIHVESATCKDVDTSSYVTMSPWDAYKKGPF